MKEPMGKTDTQLKADVLAELKYEPSVKVTDIGVLVKNGVVTLNGYASSFSEKFGAVRVVKRVAGVKAIADDIEVKLPSSLHLTDGDIATEAAHQIEWSTSIPTQTIQITVREGRVTLEGQVEWWHQKQTAENAVRYLAGVTGVTNLISIKPELVAVDVEAAIASAFERNSLVDADTITVDIAGNKVVLRGTVENYLEREEAERTAWSSCGVFSVDNQIKVEWSSGFVE